MVASIDYPDAFDATDIETVVAYIRTNYPAREIRVHDTKTLHFGYWDKSERYVTTQLLRQIQAAGYTLLHVGQDPAPEGGGWRAWMECRKHAPGENERTLTCPRCEQTFTPIHVPHQIVGLWSAYYQCPECSNHFEASPPRPAASENDGESP